MNHTIFDMNIMANMCESWACIKLQPLRYYQTSNFSDCTISFFDMNIMLNYPVNDMTPCTILHKERAQGYTKKPV